MEDEVLNIDEATIFEDRLTKCEIHAYQSFISGPYALPSEVRIAIQQQDIYTLPSRSFLRIRGKLLKADGMAAVTTRIRRNGILHLFDRITYLLNGVELDQTRDVGVTASMKNYVSLSPNELATAQMSGWGIDNDYHLGIHTNGFFEVCVPLSMVLGFAEDYRRVVINSRQELVLLLTNTHLNAVVAAAVNPEQVELMLTSIEWMVPHIQVSTAQRVKLLRHVEQNDSMQIAFRSWSLETYPALPASRHITWNVKSSLAMEKPRFIIIGLQTGRQNALQSDRSSFDACGIRNVKVYLNSESYPYVDIDADFNDGRYMFAYHMYAQFQNAYYGKVAAPVLSPTEFAAVAPLIVFDVSKQDDRITTNIVDCRIEITARHNMPANTYAFCLLIHDRMATYNCRDGNVKVLS